MLASLADQQAWSKLCWFSISDVWITGLPDIVGVCNGRFFALELKAEDGTLAPRQREWLALFAQCGAIAAVVRADHRGPLHAIGTFVGREAAEILDNRFIVNRCPLPE